MYRCLGNNLDVETLSGCVSVNLKIIFLFTGFSET